MVAGPQRRTQARPGEDSFSGAEPTVTMIDDQLPCDTNLRRRGNTACGTTVSLLSARGLGEVLDRPLRLIGDGKVHTADRPVRYPAPG